MVESFGCLIIFYIGLKCHFNYFVLYICIYIYIVCMYVYINFTITLPLFVTLKKVYDRNVVNKYGLYLLLGVII